MFTASAQQRKLERYSLIIRNNLVRMKGNGPDKDMVHDIRLSIKKTRALLQLHSSIWQEQDLVVAARLKSIFDLCGQVRFAQLLLEFMDKRGIKGRDATKHYKRIISLAYARIRVHQREWTGQLEMLPAQVGFRDISRTQMTRWLQGRLRQLQLMLATPLDPQLLHEARKQIKNILYVTTAIPPAGKKELVAPHPPSMFRRLDQVQDLIGNWHDTLAAIEALQQQGFKDTEPGMKKAKQKLDDEFKRLEQLLQEDGFISSSRAAT